MSVEYFILGKVNNLCINNDMEGERTHVHTHSSHSQTSRLLSTSLSLVPHSPIYLLCVRIRDHHSSSSNLSVCRFQVPEDTNTHIRSPD